MRETLFGICWACALVLTPVCAQESSGGRIAFIKGNEIYTANVDGSGVQRLTEDGTEKFVPLWSGDGTRLAFQRRVERERALADIQIVGADGKPVREILFRPPGSGLGMRGVEQMWWSGSTRLVLLGSTNPQYCEYAAISVDTGLTTAELFVYCRGFVESPDRSHVAHSWGPGVFSGPEGQPDGLEIDGATVYPERGAKSTSRFLSALQWSADSSSVAVLEEDSVTKLKYATVATTKGLVTRVQVPMSFELPMVLDWAGNTLTLEAEGTRYSIDLSAKVLREAAPDIEERLSVQAEAKRTVSDARKRGIELAKKLGAKSEEDIDVFVPGAGAQP